MRLPAVTKIKGVGETRKAKLERLGIKTVEDLLLFLPRDYEDWNPVPIASLRPGEVRAVCGSIVQIAGRRAKTRKLHIVQARFRDETGELSVIWFFPNQFMAKQIQQLAGRAILLRGKVEADGASLSLRAPDWQLAGKSVQKLSLQPVYPLTEGLTQPMLRTFIGQALSQYQDSIPEILPHEIRRQFSFPLRAKSIRAAHCPTSIAEAKSARNHLAFEELFVLALAMLESRVQKNLPPAPRMAPDGPLTLSFLRSLPFTMTGAQKRVVREIGSDLEKPLPMRRLLQGDVGSGKTVVAAYAMVKAAENGLQAALMAPTELLAEQHFRNLQPMFEAVGLKNALLTARLNPREQMMVKEGLASGEVKAVVGTHSLLGADVHFHSLGLAVIDEQHRFGVNQREILASKGNAHVLAMSATPIPRTLALTLYGDLDISLLDERPPGRQRIDTRWISPNDRAKVYQFIRKQVKEGRQAYIIYPMIEGALDPKMSCIHEAERLKREYFPDMELAVLHGQMPSVDQDRTMRAFVKGTIQILVATTVVEVGVDVPNASVMVIEHADRYGLAQLHQLRGRVGRGPFPSYCLLIAAPQSEAGKHRLNAFRRSDDGFQIAEIDLAIRGPGEFLGVRQSGLLDLRIADLRKDARMVPHSWRTARKVFESGEYRKSFLRDYVLEKLDKMRDGGP